MTRPRIILTALVILASPLLASGVAEALDFGRLARTSCYWPDVELFVNQESGQIVLAEDDDEGQSVAMLSYDSLSTRYTRERIACSTYYYTSRKLRVIFVDGSDRVVSTEDELKPFRVALQQYLREQSESSDIVAEAGMPNVHWGGIHWPGVYANGVLLLTMFSISAMMCGASMYALSPRARAKRRMQIGHCVRCDYDLRGSDGTYCPECGADRIPDTN